MVNKPPKRVMISGVAGFIGRNVASHYRQCGYETIGMDIVQQENAPSFFLTRYFRKDLEKERIGFLLQKYSPRVFIHCAGRASVDLSVIDPDADFRASVPMTFSILDSLRRSAPGCKFIFLSSAAVYGNPRSLPVGEDQPADPISPYGFHKLACELICREFSVIYGLPTAIIRIFSAYGQGLRRQVLWDTCLKAHKNREVVVLRGTGNETRDFIHVHDIAQAIEIVGRNGLLKGETYNLGCGVQISIRKVAELLISAMGMQRRLRFDGVVPRGIPLNWCADIQKIKKIGFAASISPEEGIRKYGKWFLSENG